MTRKKTIFRREIGDKRRQISCCIKPYHGTSGCIRKAVSNAKPVNGRDSNVNESNERCKYPCTVCTLI